MLKSICKILILFFFVALNIMPALAEEGIENFESLIIVNKDGSLSIEENLTVRHEGIKIRRGITKILPAGQGEFYQIHEVLRNGIHEPWNTTYKNGIYILSTGTDTLLQTPDTSVFTIRYTMYDALRRVFNKPYNELYLNLTSGSTLPIKHMHVSVRYPEGTNILSQYGYLNNDTKQQYTPGASFDFYNLLPGDEATIAQIFSRGTVDIGIPTIWRILLYALLATFIYYLLAWFFVGRDPTPHAIVPDWEIPHGLSALDAANIINDGKMPKNSFLIHLLWLIHQKAISIREIQKGQFAKTKGFEITSLPTADKTNPEIKLFISNFPKGTTIYANEPDNEIAYYAAKLNQKTTERMEKRYYHKRTFYTFLGALFLPLAWIAFFPDFLPIILASSIFLFIAIRSRNIHICYILACNIYPLLLCINFGNIWLLTLIIPYIALILIFKYLLFQPSIIGQRSKEKIAGLKMFLKTINGSNIGQKNIIRSKDTINMSMEKRLTPEDMENLFPYAVAFGLEKAWEQKFKAIFGISEWQNLVYTDPHYQNDFTVSLNRITYGVATHPIKPNHKSLPISLGRGGFGGGFGGGGFGGGGFGGR